MSPDEPRHRVVKTGPGAEKPSASFPEPAGADEGKPFATGGKVAVVVAILPALDNLNPTAQPPVS